MILSFLPLLTSKTSHQGLLHLGHFLLGVLLELLDALSQFLQFALLGLEHHGCPFVAFTLILVHLVVVLGSHPLQGLLQVVFISHQFDQGGVALRHQADQLIGIDVSELERLRICESTERKYTSSEKYNLFHLGKNRL